MTTDSSTCRWCDRTVGSRWAAALIVCAWSLLMLGGLLWGVHGTADAQSGALHVERLNQIGGAVAMLAAGPDGVLYVGDGAGLIAAEVAPGPTILPRTRTVFSGVVNDLIVHDRTGYLALANRPDLYVLDLQQPLTPTVVTSLPQSAPILRLRRFDDRLYAVSDQAMEILDVSTPAEPAALGAYTVTGDSWVRDVAVVGDHAYLAGRFPGETVEIIPGEFFTYPAGLAALDVSNPLVPQFVFTKTIWHYGLPTQGLLPDRLALHGTDLLATATAFGFRFSDHHTLRRLDATTPQSLQTSDSAEYVSLGYAPFGHPAVVGFAVQDRYAFALTANSELRVIDLEDTADSPAVTILRTIPLAPEEVFVEDPAHSLFVDGDQGYVGTDAGEVIPIGIASPLSPTIQLSLALLGSGLDVAIQPAAQGRNLIVAGPAAVSRVRLDAPSTPIFTGRVPLGNAAHLAVVGNKAYVAGRTAADPVTRVQVLDLAAPPDALLVGTVPLGPLAALATGDGRLYVTELAIDDPNVAEYLHVLDTTAGAVPALDASYPLNDASQFLQVQDGRLYRITRGGNFEIFSLADPKAPALLGSLDLDTDQGWVGTATVHSGAAYVLRWGTPRVDLLDVRIPGAITVVGALNLPQPASAVTASNSMLFLGMGERLLGYQLDDPLAPTLAVSTTVAGPIQALQLQGDRLYAAQGDAGVAIYSVNASQLSLPLMQAP